MYNITGVFSQSNSAEMETLLSWILQSAQGRNTHWLIVVVFFKQPNLHRNLPHHRAKMLSQRKHLKLPGAIRARGRDE